MRSSYPPEETASHEVQLPVFRTRPRLEWTDASGATHSVAVVGKMVVGSAPSAAIVIEDKTVSRVHAAVEARSDGLWIRDLGSRNGTFVEGMMVTGARVPKGARIELGAVAIRLDYAVEKTPIEVWPHKSFGGLVGSSAPMRELFSTLGRIAPLDVSVLIQGETGTGKDLVARAIHEASPRASGPFIVVDCAALPESLLDAELFGHAKGAFTGAVAARSGAIEAADGGTVFLDEVGELPLSMQPKLLRVLESRTVRRVGESAHRRVDVRFISATHRDVLTMVNEGTFREDLYFRLSVMPVAVPPLRERRADIEDLVHHFWRLSGGKGSLSPDLVRELASRPWRGNVRELRNFVERARALGAEAALAMLDPTTSEGRESPPSTRRADAAERDPGGSPTMPPSPGYPFGGDIRHEAIFERTYRDFREAWLDGGEREYVRRLLERHNRNVAAAARAAAVDRTYIYRLIRKHSL